MTAYRVGVTCPSCGRDVTHITAGQPVAGTRATTIAACGPCRRRWQVTVTLRALGTSS